MGEGQDKERDETERGPVDSTQRESERQTDRELELELELENFQKDCSLGSVKNLTTSPC